MVPQDYNTVQPHNEEYSRIDISDTKRQQLLLTDYTITTCEAYGRKSGTSTYTEGYELDHGVAYSYVSKTSAKTDVCENRDYKITTCEAYGRKSGASTPTDDYELDYADDYSYVGSTNANSDIPAYDTHQQSTGDYRMSACEAYETNTGTSDLTPSDDYEQEHGAAYSYVTTTLAHLQGVQTQSRSPWCLFKRR